MCAGLVRVAGRSLCQTGAPNGLPAGKFKYAGTYRLYCYFLVCYNLHCSYANVKPGATGFGRDGSSRGTSCRPIRGNCVCLPLAPTYQLLPSCIASDDEEETVGCLHSCLFPIRSLLLLRFLAAGRHRRESHTGESATVIAGNCLK